jgi:type IV fimbrial biogenesis protein FimT
MMKRPTRGFTLTEALVTVAVIGILLGLAAPPFYDYLLVQRLKGVHAQVVSDVVLARAESATRGTILRVAFRENTEKTCYTLFVNHYNADTGERCNCTNTGSPPCGSLSSEVRTHEVPRSSGVTVLVATGSDTAFGFSHVTGALVGVPTDQGVLPLDSFTIETSISGGRKLKTILSQAGRPTACSVGGTNLGAPAC